MRKSSTYPETSRQDAPRRRTTLAAIIGWKLSQDRAAQGLTQEQVAARLGVTQSAWSRVERGETDLSLPDVFLVAHRLRVSPAAFVQGVDAIAQRLVAQGVEVIIGQPPAAQSAGKSNAAWVVGAALGALVLAALTARK